MFKLSTFQNCWLAFALLAGFSFTSSAQDQPTPAGFAAGFEQPYENIASLTRQLTAPFQTEEEKAEVIFAWIANHVRYDCKKFHNPERRRVTAAPKEELEQKMLELRRKNAEKTAKHRKGVCQDYSELFKAMCDEAGIEAKVISGNARDFYKPFRNPRDNPHAWNAVKIDGQWHLLDATWAAGYTNPEVTKFSRNIGPGFFKTPPEWFIQHHFPDDPAWQLLEQPLDEKTFSKLPMINYGQNDYPILDFSARVQKSGDKKFDQEIRLKFERSPAFFMMTNSRQKPVDFSHSKENDFDVFRFSGKGAKDVIIFGSESMRSSYSWLARYDL